MRAGLTIPGKVLPARGGGILIAWVITPSVLFIVPGRTDYLGHYLAGFGCTLLALIVSEAIAWRPEVRTIVVVGAAIAVGYGLGWTIFFLADFDPLDFAAQSLGALEAGVTILALGSSRPRSYMLLAAIASVALGVRFALV